MKFRIYMIVLVVLEILGVKQVNYPHTSPVVRFTKRLSKCRSPRPITYPIMDITAVETLYIPVIFHHSLALTLVCQSSLQIGRFFYLIIPMTKVSNFNIDINLKLYKNKHTP